MKTEPYIHLQDNEQAGVGVCGCRLDANQNPAFYQCALHKTAPELLKLCEDFISAFAEADSDVDGEINGCDAVDWISENYEKFKSCVLKARGRILCAGIF